MRKNGGHNELGATTVENVDKKAKSRFHKLRHDLDCFMNNPCPEAARAVINHTEAVKEDMQMYLKEVTK